MPNTEYNNEKKALKSAYNTITYTNFLRKKNTYLLFTSLILIIMFIQALANFIIRSRHGTSNNTRDQLEKYYILQMVGAICMLILQVILLRLSARSIESSYTWSFWRFCTQLAYTEFYLEVAVLPLLHLNSTLFVIDSGIVFLQILTLNLIFGVFDGCSTKSTIILIFGNIMWVVRTNHAHLSYWLPFFFTTLVYLAFMYINYQTELEIFVESYLIKRNSEVYESLLDLLPEGVAVLIDGKHLRYVNNSMYRILSCDENNLMESILNLKNIEAPKIREERRSIEVSRHGTTTPPQRSAERSPQIANIIKAKNHQESPLADIEEGVKIERKSLILKEEPPSYDDIAITKRDIGVSMKDHEVNPSEFPEFEELRKEPEEEHIINEGSKDNNTIKTSFMKEMNQSNNSYVGHWSQIDRPGPLNLNFERESEEYKHSVTDNSSPLPVPGGKTVFFRKKTFNIEAQASSEISFINPSSHAPIARVISGIGASSFKGASEISYLSNPKNAMSQILSEGNSPISSSPGRDNKKSDRRVKEKAKPKVRQLKIPIHDTIPDTVASPALFSKRSSKKHREMDILSALRSPFARNKLRATAQATEYKLRPTTEATGHYPGKVKQLKTYTTTHEDIHSACQSLMKSLKDDREGLQRAASVRNGKGRQSFVARSSLRKLFSFGAAAKAQSTSEKPKKSGGLKMEEEDYCVVVNSKLKVSETKERHLEVKLTPTLIQNKGCIMIMVKDTTDRDLITRLKETDNYKNTLMASFSHELRTPINCIISMLDLILPYVEEDLISKYINPAISSSKLLLSMVNDILDFAKIRAGKLKQDYTEFSLKEVLQESLSLFEIQCKNKGVEAKFEWDTRIPSVFRSDPKHIGQIVINLLGNALRFTMQGSITLKAEYKGPQLVCIRVRDTGVGIKKEGVKEMFSAFAKHDQQINSDGLGLGLYISQTLARRLGPATNRGIKVESEPGKGSCFYFMVESEPVEEEKENPEKQCELNDSFDHESMRPSVNMETLTRMAELGESKRNRSFKIIHVNDTTTLKESQCETRSPKISAKDLEYRLAERFGGQRDSFDTSSYIGGISTLLTPIKLNVPEDRVYSKLNISFNPQHLEGGQIEGSQLELESHSPENRSPHFDHLMNDQRSNASKLELLSIDDRRKLSSQAGSVAKSELGSMQYSQNSHLMLRTLDEQHLKSRLVSEDLKSKESYSLTVTPVDETIKGFAAFKNQIRSSEFLKEGSINRLTERKPRTDTVVLSNNNMSKFSSFGILTEKTCKCEDILIVDDNDFNLLALKQILESLQLQVVTAHNGEIAIKKVLERHESDCCKIFTIVFMDCDMPVKNGFDTTSDLKSMQKKGQLPFFPIVATTAYVGEREIKRCFDCGMDDYMNKPVIKDKLQHMLTKWGRK